LVTLKVFDQLGRPKAEDLRLEIELNLNRGKIEHEVVLLEASSEAAIRRSHQRYFADLREIVEALSDIVYKDNKLPN
jgi:hypothetical protein